VQSFNTNVTNSTELSQPAAGCYHSVKICTNFCEFVKKKQTSFRNPLPSPCVLPNLSVASGGCNDCVVLLSWFLVFFVACSIVIAAGFAAPRLLPTDTPLLTRLMQAETK
jgi:hypothetical protein